MASFRSRLAATLLPSLLLASLAAAAPAAPAAAQSLAASPRYLPFLDDVAGARSESPELTLSIGNRHVQAVMDTGSTGVVVSLYGMFPDWKTQPDIVAAVNALLPAGSDSAAPGAIDTSRLDFSRMKSITYSSSGRIMYGIYLPRAVTASGARVGGAARSITSTPVPVLVVIDEECVAKARHCTPNHAPTGIGMLGIGYGRVSPGDQYGTRTLNPFLNLAVPSAVNGYIITANGVKVGLDNNDLAMISTHVGALPHNSAMKGEWMPPQADIRLAGRPAVTGNLLLDTGITTMLMTVPSQTSSGLRIAVAGTTDTTLPGGTPVAVSLSGGSGLPVGYAFDTSQTTGMAPASVTLVGNDGSRADWKATFVNTGVRFLNGFTYIFDDSHGLIGFAQHVPGSP